MDDVIFLLKAESMVFKIGIPLVLLLFAAWYLRGFSPDREIINQLKKEEIYLSKPHALEFCMSFSTKEFAMAAADDLQEHGFSANIKQRVEGSDWLLLLTSRMLITEASLIGLREKLGAISSWHGGTYEGWGISKDDW